MLAKVTILLGVLVIATRLPGVFQPRYVRGMMQVLLGSVRGARVIAAILLLIAVLLFMALHQDHLDLPPYHKLMYAVALIGAAAGVTFAFGAAGLRRVIMRWVDKMPDWLLRALCVLGVLVGVGFVALGIFFAHYSPTAA